MEVTIRVLIGALLSMSMARALNVIEIPTLTLPNEQSYFILTNLYMVYILHIHALLQQRKAP